MRFTPISVSAELVSRHFVTIITITIGREVDIPMKRNEALLVIAVEEELEAIAACLVDMSRKLIMILVGERRLGPRAALILG